MRQVLMRQVLMRQVTTINKLIFVSFLMQYVDVCMYLQMFE